MKPNEVQQMINSSLAAFKNANLSYKSHISLASAVDKYSPITGASSEIAFFGNTKVSQPTTAGGSSSFTTNSGTTVNTGSTFDGYTLEQVVRALRVLGLLA
jgi:hypothetical protein